MHFMNTKMLQHQLKGFYGVTKLNVYLLKMNTFFFYHILFFYDIDINFSFIATLL